LFPTPPPLPLPLPLPDFSTSAEVCPLDCNVYVVVRSKIRSLLFVRCGVECLLV
jgi:hypothetical protein